MSYRDLILRAWQENELFSVLVELTYSCNLDCYYCYNDLSLRGRPLTRGQYFGFFDELRALGVLNVALTGGEPLAHPDFVAIGAKARELGFVVRIKSNGHSLRGRMAERIREEIDPFLIEVSLHGACAETHDRQTRVKGSFERLLANLREATELGLRIKINCTLTSWNEGEIEGMLEVADRLELPLQIDPEVTIRDNGDRQPLDIAVSRRGIERLFELQMKRSRSNQQLQDTELENAGPRSLGRVEVGRLDSGPGALNIGTSAKPSGVEMPSGEPSMAAKHCGAGSSGIAVDPYGNVYPCVQWRRAVGNLHRDSIVDLWRGGSFGEFRELTRAAGEMVRAQGRKGQLMAFCPGTAEARTGSPLSLYDAAERRGAVLSELVERSKGRSLPVVGS